MSKLILTSREALWDSRAAQPYPEMVEALQKSYNSGNGVFLVSSRDEPEWLKTHYKYITFQRTHWPCTKQSGKIVRAIIDVNQEAQRLKNSDIFVIGATESDFLMAVNSQSLLMGCSWSEHVHEKVNKYGVTLRSPKAIPLVIKLLEDVKPWYFSHTDEVCEIYALTNAGTYGEDDRQMLTLIGELRECLKIGNEKYSTAFKLHLLSSLLATPIFREADLWSYYPSSDSNNKEQEIIAAYSELARVTFKRRSRGPIFIRHKQSAKRHFGSGDRSDPTSQLESIHLNPEYEGKIRGKTIVVIDDYTTYGVSFGISTAMLKAAGAKKCICVAMGKYGNIGRIYDIDFGETNLYKPLNGGYTVCGSTCITGNTDHQAQLEFLDKFKTFI